MYYYEDMEALRCEARGRDPWWAAQQGRIVNVTHAEMLEYRRRKQQRERKKAPQGVEADDQAEMDDWIPADLYTQ